MKSIAKNEWKEREIKTMPAGIYVLAPGVKLRSWRLVPRAFYYHLSETAMKLSSEEWDFLKQCDGKHIQEKSTLLDSLAARKIICPATSERPRPEAWQLPVFCDNRYVPGANWSITGSCNLKCRHCFMAKDAVGAPAFHTFTWDECVSLIDEMNKCGIHAVKITGGEPLLHPNFLDILKYIDKKGMIVSEINTNGTFITDELLKSISGLSYRPLWKISLDCIGYHDWMRGVPGSEEKALQAFERCRSHGFATFAQTCVHKGNINSLLATAEKLEELGCSVMRIIRTSEAVRWMENAPSLTLGVREYYDAILEFLGEWIEKEHQMNVICWHFAEVKPQTKTYSYQPVQAGCHSFRESIPVCKGNRGVVAVTSEGELVPCNQMSGYLKNAGVSLGNVFAAPAGLQGMLQDSQWLDAVTQTAGELFSQQEKCGKCSWRRLCLGGCRAMALATGGSLVSHDPAACTFFKEGYLAKLDDVFAARSGWTTMSDAFESDIRPRSAVDALNAHIAMQKTHGM